MIKNIIFDIGHVILNFKHTYVLKSFTENKKEQKFILDNIINSPEWSKYSLIDTGYITKEDAIKIVQDRTNHAKDELISEFWNNYNKYSIVNKDVLNLITKLKNNNYKIYLLSNINPYTYDSIKSSGLFDMVDGSVLSYKEHKIKPYNDIYNTLIERYNLNPKESLFVDDKRENVITANKLGIFGEKVNPDDFKSIIWLLKKFKIKID